jgi:hypothetical protein
MCEAHMHEHNMLNGSKMEIVEETLQTQGEIVTEFFGELRYHLSHGVNNKSGYMCQSKST